MVTTSQMKWLPHQSHKMVICQYICCTLVKVLAHAREGHIVMAWSIGPAHHQMAQDTTHKKKCQEDDSQLESSSPLSPARNRSPWTAKP